MSSVFPGLVLEPFPPIERSPTQVDRSGWDQVRPSTGSFFQAAEHRGRFRFGIILAAARLLEWNGQRRAADPGPVPLDARVTSKETSSHAAYQRAGADSASGKEQECA